MAKLNKSTSTSAKMKATGAKYSTTSKGGGQKFFASSKDTQPIATSTREGVAPIPVDTLGQKITPVEVLTPAPVDPLTGLMESINTGIASSSNGAMTYGKDGFTTTQTNLTPEQQLQQNTIDRITKLMGVEQPNGEKVLNRLERDTGLNRFQKDVNTYQSQLNQIQAQSQAQQLALEGQGRGQTESFVGGEQARINREATIAALPVQANLAAAQGNLQMAQDTVNKLYAIKMQDAQNKYQFNTSLINTVYDYADKIQERKLDALKIKGQQDFQIQMNNLQFEQQKELLAIKEKYSTPTSPGAGGIYDVLDFRTANAVISQADKFASSDIVKKFNALQDARNSIAGIDAATTNPADHQAIVYYFAKALDPESVVREGEYETIKKYAQNITSRYKGEIQNAINGTGFLSQDAISNIKQTIENRYTSSQTQYNNKASEAARIIDTIAGKPVSNMVLTNFSQGASAPQEQSSQTFATETQDIEFSKPTGVLGGIKKFFSGLF